MGSNVSGTFSVRWQGLTIVKTETFYAISASGTNQPGDGWQMTIPSTTKSNPYLWTRVVTTYSDGTDKSTYSVSRQGTDGTNGTSFTPRGTALGHYENYTKLKAASIKDGDYHDAYLLDTSKDAIQGTSDAVDKFNEPSVAYFVEESDAVWYMERAEVGDAYRIGTNLWVNNGEKWVDFGDIQGPAGEDGHNLTLTVVPNKFVFDTDENQGIVGGGHTHFTYYGRFGDEYITDATEGAEFSFSFPDGCNFSEKYVNEGNTYDSAGSEGNAQGFFNTDAVRTKTYVVANKKMYAPATSSYFLLTLTYKGFSVSQRIDIECNMSLYNEDYVRNRYEMKSIYEKLEEKNGELEKTTNTLTQTAERTSADLKVVTDDYVKSAQIAMFVSHDENGVINTNVTMNADRINIDANHSIDITSDGCFTVNSTNFKLDGYGNVTCTNGNFSGTISATAGSIGGFRINENFIGSQSGYNMYLTNNRIHFGSENALSNNDGCVINLGEEEGATGVTNALDIRSVTGSSHKVNVGGFFSVLANTKDANYCAALELQSGWAGGAGTMDITNPMSGNHAILIHSGDVPGLRPSFVRLNKSKALNRYNHTIDCYNTTEEITLTLPDSPIPGQHYVILQEGRKVNFKSSKFKIHDFKNGRVENIWNSDTIGQVSEMWFNGSEWLVMFYN